MATIRKRKGKWQAQVRLLGNPNVSRTFTSRKDAYTWAQLTELNLSRRRAGLQDERTLQIPLSDLLTKYLSEISAQKSVYEIEKYIIGKWQRSSLASLPIGRISPMLIDKEMRHAQTSLKPETIRKDFGILRNLFNVAINIWEYPLSSNPVSAVRMPSVPTQPPRRLPSCTMDKIDAHYKYRKDDEFYRLVKVAILTGMRRSELLQLQNSDVNRDQQLLLVANSKNGCHRYIPMSAELIEQLPPPNHDRIFALSPQSVTSRWARLRDKLELGDVRFHDLRHEAISRFFEMGLTVPEVASISGHKTISMLFRYAHADTQRLREKILNINI